MVNICKRILTTTIGTGVQDVINRVQSLESMGQITGVMDDRGKVSSIHLDSANVAHFAWDQIA